MRVLVTGGAGFIGSHIVDALIAQSHSPFVLDNMTSGSRENLSSDVPIFETDICNADAVKSVFDHVQPDWVCHQAAQMSVSRSMREPIFDAENNVMGLLNIFDNAARVGAKRIVFASSGGVLYGDVTSPASEDAPKHPMSPYGISKWIGEQYLEFYARERGLQGVALRYSNVYGPRQNPHGEAGVVAIFCKALLNGSTATINGDGKYIRDYVYCADVARANVAALETTMPSHFTAINIGTATGTDVNQLADQIKQDTLQCLATHGRSATIPEFRHGDARAGDLRSNLISPALATRLLDWTPRVQLSDGVCRTVEWFYQQGEKSLP